MQLAALVEYLDGYLRVADTPDDPLALNGLQVESAGEATRLAVAVDACQFVFDAAAAERADVLIVHHGLFWGGLSPLSGRHYRRVKTLLDHGIALYGAHLPLDRHPDVGNNAGLARLLGMSVAGWWGEYRGSQIGVRGELDCPREELAARVAATLGGQPRVIPGGPARCRKVGIVTGAGGSMIEEAAREGLDTFITGEGKHHSYFDAEELGVNVLYAGHYATETVGVKALGEHLHRKFGLAWTFIDHPTGL